MAPHGFVGLDPWRRRPEETNLKIIAVVPACLGSIGLITCAAAQSLPIDADDSLSEVVVVATRTPVPAWSVGNSVTVLDQATIKERQAVAVADLLAQTPGLTVASTGGIAQPTSVFIRGAQSDETVIVIDGVKFNDPSTTGGGSKFDSLLLANIGRIEILRGAQSALYGSQAMGGVVSIVSAEPVGRFDAGVTVEGGSHDTGYGLVTLGGKGDQLLWRAAADYYGTGGIPCFDAAYGGRRDCNSQVGGASGQLRYDFNPLVQLDVRGYYTQSREDFDGYDTPTFAFGDDHEYGKQAQFVGYAGLRVYSPDGRLTHRVSVQYTDSQTRNYDPLGPANEGLSSTETFYGIGQNLRQEYQGTWDFNSVSHVVFGAQHEHSTISTDSPAYDIVPAPVDHSIDINSAYAQAQAQVATGLTLTGGLRYDHHSTFGGHTTGQLAAAWALNDQHTILRASFGQGFKAPSLYQLYSAYGYAALSPEQANSWDVGIEQHLLGGRMTLSATYFQRSAHGLINYFYCGTGATNPLCQIDPQGFYANIARATAHGLELQGSFKPMEDLSIDANFTLTDTEDQSPGSATYGQELSNRPKDAGNVNVSYRWPTRVTTSAALRFAGRSLDVSSGRPLWLGGYALLDLRVSCPVTEKLELYGRIDNAGNKHYETVYQYGTLGRVAYVGLRAGF